MRILGTDLLKEGKMLLAVKGFHTYLFHAPYKPGVWRAPTTTVLSAVGIFHSLYGELEKVTDKCNR